MATKTPEQIRAANIKLCVAVGSLFVFAVVLLFGANYTIKLVQPEAVTLAPHYGEITFDEPLPLSLPGSVIGWKIYRFLTNDWLVGGVVLVLLVVWVKMFWRFMYYRDLARSRKELADRPDEEA